MRSCLGSARAAPTDGNFVLSEIELKWGTGTNAPDTDRQILRCARRFLAKRLHVSQAIDGKVESRPERLGRRRRAGNPTSYRHVQAGEADRHHQWRDVAAQCCSSISANNFCWADSAFTSPPAKIRWISACPRTCAAARAPAGQRKPEQAAAILDYYRNSDTEFWKRKQAARESCRALAGGSQIHRIAKSAYAKRKSRSASIPTWCSCARMPKPAANNWKTNG